MRIALVTDTFTPQVNGVTTVCRRIVRVVRQARHDAVVVAPTYPSGATGPGELRIPSLPFPLYPSIRLSLPLYGRVDRFLDAFGPDLIHVATEGPLGSMGRRFALRRGIPLVTSYHTHFPQYARHYGVGLLAPLVWRWLVQFHGAARLTHTPGEAVRRDLTKRGIPHATVWGRGVDTDQFRPECRDERWRRWLNAGGEGVIVLHVGRLASEKNLDVLIAAFQLARQRLGPLATFVVAGEGPLRRRVAAHLPFARLLGFLDPDSLAALYASADVCVLPSHTETCGLVALEAMASGTPVIAADAGGLRESVRDGENGTLVPPADATGFAAAIVALAAHREHRRDLGAGARHTALERDVTTEDAALLTQYAGLVGKPAPETTVCAA